MISSELAPIAMVISFVSLIAAGVAIYLTFRNARVTVELRLTERESKINDAFAQFGVRTPFAHRLAIPHERDAIYTPKAVLLLHQITLYREVFEHRDLVSKERFDAYTKWAHSILRPWIEADDDLRRTFDPVSFSLST